MLTVISSFLGAIIVMGMDSAQSMYFFKHKKDGKPVQAQIVSAILQWRIFWGTIIVIISTIFSPLINAFFFNGELSLKYYLIAFAGVLFSQVLYQSIEVMRLLYRPWSYICMTTLHTFLSTVFVLLLILYLDQGILGFFLGSFCASVLTLSFGWYQAREYIDFRKIHVNWWPQLIRFGAPLLPSGISIYLMNTADRWFIQHYHGQEALGLFAVGAKFSMLMVMAVETFRKAWWPVAMDSMHSSDGPKVFRMIARLYMGLGISALVVLTLLSPWLLKFLTAQAYHHAWPIVCILLWQSLLYGFFLIASAGIWKVEKTYLNLYLMIGAALVGLFLNWFFVPEFGGVGAAFATVLTYLIWNAASMFVSERYWRVNFSWFVLGFQILIGASFTTWFIFKGKIYDSYLTNGIGLFIAVLILLISLSRSEILKVRRLIKIS